VKQRVKAVMSQVFGIPQDSIGDDASPEVIKNWDSVKHLNLVLTLEEEFDVAFTDEQIIELMSYQVIVEKLEEISASAA